MTVTLRFDIRRDLFDSAQRVTRYMIDRLVAEFGLERSDAYIICSIACDLHLSEVVDAPNCVVSLRMPLAIIGS